MGRGWYAAEEQLLRAVLKTSAECSGILSFMEAGRLGQLAMADIGCLEGWRSVPTSDAINGRIEQWVEESLGLRTHERVQIVRSYIQLIAGGTVTTTQHDHQLKQNGKERQKWISLGGKLCTLGRYTKTT